jgi:tRNA(Ile)-lysidine synthase
MTQPSPSIRKTSRAGGHSRASSTRASKTIPAPVTADEFAGLMGALAVDLTAIQNIAVAVSGGGDSMALLHLLARWVPASVTVHVLTVDHGLRPESKTEAKQVAAWVQNMLGIIHQTLTWRGVKPTTKIAETARAKRYDLMAAYCRQHNIRHLFLAHNLDDQAETFLLRLSAGSGPDGLSGMRGIERLAIDMLILRPLLSVSHERLLATLRAAGQDWVEDPTNVNQDYARPRLRAARDVLAREGLTPERLAATADRCARARDSVAWAVDQAWRQVMPTRAVSLMKVGAQKMNQSWAPACAGDTTLDLESLKIDRMIYESWPDDLQIRVLMRAIATVAVKAPRLHQVEALWADLRAAAPTASRPVRQTLGGAVITAGVKGVAIKREK